MEGFLRYRFGGLIFGGAYTWRGLFSEFYGNSERPLPFDVRWLKTPLLKFLDVTLFGHFFF